MAIYIILSVAVVVMSFIWWRWTSVERGAKQRNQKILKRLDSIGQRLSDNKQITREEIYEFANNDELRGMLHAILREFARLDLFPNNFLDIESQAKTSLAYWLMHPNELQEAPAKIELVDKIQRIINERKGDFFVLRYKMPQGHWAEKDGWLLGLSGPFWGDEKPYVDTPEAFSRCGDKYGDINPAELVDWYVSMRQRKLA
jgi:hypothetical protein